MKKRVCLLLFAVLAFSVFTGFLSESASADVQATSVKLGVTKATMDLNGKSQGKLRYTVYPAGADDTLTWLSSNTGVVAVSADGVVTAVGVGKATIGVRGENTPWSKCTITVKNSGAAIVPQTKPSVRFGASSVALDLNGKTTAKIPYAVTPVGNTDPITWVTTNAAVVTVSSDGTLTAVGTGSAIVGARVNGGSWAKCKISVTNTISPLSVNVESNTVTVSPGGTTKLAASVLPANADQRLYWKSANKVIASVAQDGTIKGVSQGKTYIRVYSLASKSLYQQINVTVEKANAPTSIQVSQSIYVVSQGSTFKINATAQPATASQAFKWVSSNPQVASVTSEGYVIPVRTGKAIIRIYSVENPAVYVSVGVKVSNESPTSIAFSTTELYLSAGDTLTLKPTILPVGAKQDVKWATSSASVVTVDANGLAKAVGSGSASITCTTVYGGLSAKVTITVLDTQRATAIPARYTALSGLKANVAKIDAIRQSAVNTLADAVRTGSISSYEATARKNIVSRAFAMYRFPWMPMVEQEYWRAASSLGGQKDYKVGRVYYGLPYIQCGKTGDYLSRRFSNENAVAAGYYTDTGMGYYFMNRAKKYDGMYVGNDCSSFASIAQWGLNNAHSFDYTSVMLTTSVYKTVPFSAGMRPGDVLVQNGHCVIFLYYTDDAHTQMMIIEQGGGNSLDIHNTVTCSVVNVAPYAGSYTLRRQASFS